MTKKPGNVLKGLAGLLLAGVLVWFSFRTVNLDTFVQGLASCNWSGVAVAVAAGIGALVVRGLRWSMMLSPLDPQARFFPVFNAYNVGNLFSFAIPGSGEFVRSGFVTGGGASYEKVLGTEVAERILDMLCLLLLLSGVLLLSGGRVSEFFTENVVERIAGNMTAAGIIAIVAALALVAGLGVAIFRLREKVRLFDKICRVVKGLGSGVAAIRLVRHKWAFAIYTAMLWAFYWLEVQATFMALPGITGLTPADTLFISVLGSFASVIPSPGGMGAYHFLVASAMTALYGSTWDEGILFATLIHEPHNLMILLIGAASAFFVKRNRQK